MARRSLGVKAFFPAILLGAALALGGCGRTPVGGAAAEKTQLHKNVPPHGGTPVALGEDYCLELVRDAEAGTLSAYVLDDEMEEFIRIPAPSLALLLRVRGEDRPLVLAAVANSGTGETVGDTSLFEADWIKGAANFAGRVRAITIHGTTFTDVPFVFPAAPDKG
jgi:hypothetical protein